MNLLKIVVDVLSFRIFYIGSKLRLPKGGTRDEKGDGRLSRHSSGRYSGKFSGGEPDPGVISEDEDEFRVILSSIENIGAFF